MIFAHEYSQRTRLRLLLLTRKKEQLLMAEASSGKQTTPPTPRARTQRGKSRKDVEKTHHVLFLA